MIASVQYIITGNETVGTFGTNVYINPASGLEIIDVIVKGLSTAMVVDNEYGLVMVQDVERGDLVQVIYKTLPRTRDEFYDGDFSIEFA